MKFTQRPVCDRGSVNPSLSDTRLHHLIKRKSTGPNGTPTLSNKCTNSRLFCLFHLNSHSCLLCESLNTYKYVQFLLEYYSKSLISTFCFFIKGKHFFQANNRRSSAAAPPSTPPFRGRGVSTTPARPASCRPSATYSASRTAVTTRTSLPVRYFQYLSLVPFSSLQAMDGFESFYFKNSIYQK